MSRPPGTEIEVIPHTGEIIDLSDPVAVAKAYRVVQDLEAQLRQAKGTLGDALIAQKSILGTGTMRFEGLSGPVTIKGGTDTIYNAVAIKTELLAAGMPRERVAEIVVETIDYKVSAVEAKKAAAANAEYREIIERHRQIFPKRPTVVVP